LLDRSGAHRTVLEVFEPTLQRCLGIPSLSAAALGSHGGISELSAARLRRLIDASASHDHRSGREVNTPKVTDFRRRTTSAAGASQDGRARSGAEGMALGGLEAGRVHQAY
jgi:hypothetical protein